MEGVIKYQVLFAAIQTLHRSSPSPPKDISGLSYCEIYFIF